MHLLVQHPVRRILLRLRQLGLQVRDDAVGQFACLGKVSGALRLLHLGAGALDIFLQLLRRVDFFLLGLPADGQVGGLLFKAQQFRLQLDQPFLRGRIGFTGQRLALDLQLDDAAVQFVDRFRLRIHFHAQA